MAKFPSLKQLIGESTQTARRFPLTLLYAIVGSFTAIYAVGINFSEHELEKTLACIIMVCSLGLTLSFSITIFSERNGYPPAKIFLLQGIALLLLAGYYFFIRNYFVQIEFIRYALINVALHLFASFAAYTGSNNLTGFWQFNKALFLRLFFSAIYSATLYLGICLAMAAVDQLFKVKIDGKNYFRLWVFITGIFNTWFFLAGVPKNLQDLNSSEDYPKGLKIFTQYVLLPLVTLYLLILYTYMGKILIQQSLPKGWVSYLVIGFSVAGVLALLLIYPIRNKEGNNWIRIFSKWFYGALYPLVIMLFVAIGRRISDYGITENRYFIIVLALWLAAVSTYFLFSKEQNIKRIPLSLCLIALLCSFGPWGAFSVSEKNQFGILEKILTENKVLVNGKVDAKHPEVNDTVAERVTSIVKYFDEMHGFDKFRPWFNQNIDTLVADSERYTRVTNIMKLLNIAELYSYQRYEEDEDGEVNRYFNHYAEYNNTQVKNISGFDYEINFSASGGEPNYYQKYTLLSDTFTFSIRDSVEFLIRKNGVIIQNLNMDDFNRILADSTRHHGKYNSNIPQRLMEKTFEDSLTVVKLQFQGIYGFTKNKKYNTQSASGTCLVKIKTPPPN